MISLVKTFLEDASEQAQPRVTAVAGKQDNNNDLNSAIITEVELAPGQRFADFATNFDQTNAPMVIGLGVDAGTGALNELRIERDGEIIDPNDDNFNLEATVARAVADASFANSGEIVSLVKAFSEGRKTGQGQARISGGSAIVDNSSDTPIRSGVLGEVELVPGQLLATTQENQTHTLVKVTSAVRDDLGDNNGVIVEGLSLNYQIAEESGILESAIAEAVNQFNFEDTSDAVSLVQAFTSNNPDQNIVINEPDSPSIALD